MTRTTRALVCSLLLAWTGLAGATPHPSDEALRGLAEEVARAPVTMAEAEAKRIREATISHFSSLAMAGVEVDGRRSDLVASSRALQVASVFAHRHRRFGDAKAIATAVASLFESLDNPMASATAKTLLRKLEIQEERLGDGTATQTIDTGEESSVPPAVWKFLGGLAGLGGLVVVYLLLFRSKDPSGFAVADAKIHKEAERALQIGVRLLQRGMVDQAVRYFRQVADLETALRDRSKYFLALVSLRKGDPAAMTQTIEELDFAAIDNDEAYDLADQLERRGQIMEARRVFEKLYLTDIGFRDVKSRLEHLREEAERFSGDEIASMISQRVIDTRYKGVTTLGHGGMGFVYKGTDSERDGLEVAIKVLSPFYANNEQAFTRFVREATGIAKLDHPNLVKIYDVFQANLPYYTMELLPDRTLSDRLAEAGGRLDVAEAAGHVRGIARGLGLVHSMGVTHRDMKPDNVILLDNGEVKVIDFGIAHFEAEEEMTVTGQVIGTPLYMSPEQVRAMDIDQRSDIYSVGCMLYEMLTGRVPFERMLDRGLMDAPRPGPDAGIPEPVVTVLMRSLGKSPNDRYQDLESFSRDLDAAAGIR